MTDDTTATAEAADVWSPHANQLGNWCPHSGTAVSPAALEQESPRCPALCPDSFPEPAPEPEPEEDRHAGCPADKFDVGRFVIIHEADCDADDTPPGIAAPVKAHRHVTLMTEREVSRMLDLLVQQIGADGVVGIFHIGADGTLQKVTVGQEVRVDSDEECPFMYATSKLTTADGTLVGYVNRTDH